MGADADKLSDLVAWVTEIDEDLEALKKVIERLQAQIETFEKILPVVARPEKPERKKPPRPTKP